MPYAAKDQVSQSPIEGGIEITADQYRQGIEAITNPDKVVRIDNGFEIKDKPQPTTYWFSANDQRQTEPGELVPAGATTSEPPTLYHNLVDGEWVEDADALLRAENAAVRNIDNKASEVRGRFISSGTGQSAVYLNKYEEAKEYKAASSPTDSNYPYLNAEANRRNMAIGDLADEVIATRNAWTNPAGATIEAERVGGKQDVRDASTIADKIAAKDTVIATLDAIKP